MDKKFKVYEQVWVVLDNKPQQMMIYDITEVMNLSKSGTDFHYRLVGGKYSAGFGSNKPMRFATNKMFNTKDELLDSLR